MRLGELRAELKKYEGLADEANVNVAVADDSGQYVDQDLDRVEPYVSPDGETYLYFWTEMQ